MEIQAQSEDSLNVQVTPEELLLKHKCNSNTRVTVSWPFPRLDGIIASLTNPDMFEWMDGLSYLRGYGVCPAVLDSTKGILNPLRKRGDIWAGIDPVRFLRMVWSCRRYDVLVSIGPSPSLLFVLLKRVLHLNKPVVVIDPSVAPHYLNSVRMNRQVLPYVDCVIVFSRVHEEYLQKEYGGRVKVARVYHRIDSLFFDKSKCRKLDCEPYIVAVGNDSSRDYERLFEAVQGLPIRVICNTKRKIMCPAPPNVTLQSEYVHYRDLRDLYGNAEAVVVPLRNSLHPGGINTLLEAMCIGCPVVVSGSVGIIDYVKHGVTAWVVTPEDTAALRAGIENVLQDQDLRRRLSINAREFCVSVCAMPVYAEKIARILKSVTAHD
jgi:glycosyltransferase involved in cell wall biosynthesis